MQNSLKKGIVAILFANIVNLVFNLLTNFLLPKYLSMESYAAIKTFQLYTNYIGVFSLGYADGMYLRYGGKELASINHNELKDGMLSFRLMMIIESVILIPIAVLSKDTVILAFSFTIISRNMSSYFKNLYQAVGEFKRYGKILNWTTISTFAANIFLLFVVKTDSFIIYLIAYAVVDGIIWVALEWNAAHFMDYRNGYGRLSINLLWEDIKSGFLLMVGNFSNILLSSMDRWFVKLMMSTAQFAYYSFAVSLEGFLNVAITPITTTLYNYFCNHSGHNEVVRTRRYVILFGSVIAATAFPAKFIIEVFLQNYIGSVNVLFILFATQMVYVIIKGIYINLYKATKKQNLYFARLLLVLIIGAILNCLFVRVYPFMEAFAYGTLCSAFIWLVISICDFKQYGFHAKEMSYLVGEVILLIFLGQKVNALLGLGIYIATSLFMMIVLMREEIKSIVIMTNNMLKRSK